MTGSFTDDSVTKASTEAPTSFAMYHRYQLQKKINMFACIFYKYFKANDFKK